MKRAKQQTKAYWLRVEIEGDYEWAPELMQDVADDTANVTHVIKTEFMSEDELMESIRQGIHAAIHD